MEQVCSHFNISLRSHVITASIRPHPDDDGVSCIAAECSKGGKKIEAHQRIVEKNKNAEAFITLIC